MVNLKRATLIIILLGVVSLFGDFTYEGARSIIPTFFTTVLGGSVLFLGIATGIGDFVGYSFRVVSGRLADTTRRYWALTFIGYALSLLLLPMLAFVHAYILAAVIIVLDRFGKAVRQPAKDYIISTLAEKGKSGRAFAISEGLDQIGAIVGPLVVSAIIFYQNSYTDAFMVLFIPGIIALVILAFAYRFYIKVPPKKRKVTEKGSIPFRNFILYSLAVAVSAAGLYGVSFILFGAQAKVSTYIIPIIFLVAMAGEGAFGFVFGILYDRMGRKLVYLSMIIAPLIPLALGGGSLVYFFLAALMVGAVMGIQDTVMRAVVSSMVPPTRRGFAFGIFNALYGFGLMVSSITIGYLYYASGTITAYIIVLQVASIVLLYLSFRGIE
jgi:MFS family permease